MTKTLNFAVSCISPCPMTGKVVHVQYLLDGHQVSGDDGIEITVRGFLITVASKERCGRNNTSKIVPD